MRPTELSIGGLRVKHPVALAIGVAGWAGWTSAATAAAAWAGWFAELPGTVLAASLAIGAISIRPRRAGWAPVVVACAVGAAWLAEGLGLSPVMAGGAVAGWWAVQGADRSTDRLDGVNGALAGAAFAGIGLWAASSLPLGGATGLAMTGALIGGFAALSQLPLALVHPVALPRRRVVEMTLGEPYRERPLRALKLFRTIRSARPDADLRDRLAELATWVYRLAQALQTLDLELREVDELDVRDRIATLRADVETASDSYTRERLIATADHMEGLLDHASRLQLERHRLSSLQDCAMASLEEARLGVALARSLPGEQSPDGLDDVLQQLRDHARQVGRERATRRELAEVPTY